MSSAKVADAAAATMPSSSADSSSSNINLHYTTAPSQWTTNMTASSLSSGASGNSCLDDQIQRLRRCEYLREGEVKALCLRAREILVDESNVQRVDAPVTVSTISVRVYMCVRERERDLVRKYNRRDPAGSSRFVSPFCSHTHFTLLVLYII
jgi:hypothetical protein